jgi:hypothetical protein
MNDDSVLDARLDGWRNPDPCGCELQQLVHSVKRHAQDEAGSIAAYERIQHACGDPAIAGVLGVILEDEQRHHAMLERVAARLQAEFNWSVTRVPDASVSDQTVTAAELRALEQEERNGAQALRELAYRCRDSRDGLTAVLLESMAMDSEKHAHLLGFAERRLTSHRSRTSD